MEGCWCLCVWRSARGPRELVNASLPELLASVGAVTRHPTNWAAADEALLVKGLDPAVCWTRFSSQQVGVSQLAELILPLFFRPSTEHDTQPAHDSHLL
jgi:hypothetical protein